ncbi:MAG TPA: hypothetical protein PLP18_04850, partial [Smithellaceae bacterium]|nr:hypothetical protein [Smithellaceae bacterium]
TARFLLMFMTMRGTGKGVNREESAIRFTTPLLSHQLLSTAAFQIRPFNRHLPSLTTLSFGDNKTPIFL